MQNIKPILKALYRKSLAGPVPVREGSFVAYYEAIIKDALTANFSNSIVVENSKSPQAMVLFEYLPWDTAIFRKRMARLDYFLASDGCGASSRDKVVKKALLIARQNRVAFLSAKVGTGDFQAAQILEGRGFILADIQVTFSVSVDRLAAGQIHKNIRSWRASDLTDAVKIAKDSFIFNRFFNDPRLDKKCAGNMYGEWVRNACLKNPQGVLVWQENSRIRGFIICKSDRFSENSLGLSIGHIDLVAVDDKSKGKGIGTHLARAALEKFKTEGADIVEVRTQHANVPAVNSFLKSGFKAYGHGLSLTAGTVFHKWFD